MLQRRLLRSPPLPLLPISPETYFNKFLFKFLCMPQILPHLRLRYVRQLANARTLPMYSELLYLP